MSASAQLAQLAETHWQHTLETTLPLRMKLGLPIERLPDVSLAGAEAEAAYARDLLHRLEGIPGEALTPDERATLGAILWQSRMTVEGLDHYWLSFPVTPYASPISTVHTAFLFFPFAEAGDLDAYLALLRQYPDFLQRIHDKLTAQRRRGILIPKAELPTVRNLVASCLQEGGSTLFRVVPERLESLASSESAIAAFHRKVGEMETVIQPRLMRLVEFLGEDYAREAPTTLGLWQYPGGDAYYDYLVRQHTTLEVTPEEVHRIGLQEVARLEAEMAEVGQRLGFSGLPEELLRRMGSDPRLARRHPTEPEALRERMLALAQGIEPHLDQHFLQRPGAPYDVRRLDAGLEGAMAFGFYQDPTPGDPVGTYFFNGSNLEDRPLVVLEALVYHELAPGHHLQLNLASENDALIPLRRELRTTAYIEGWGEYASSLGVELGRYQDPLDYYGRLLMDMLVSVRLVVDTGIHRLRWTEEEAFAYMRQRLLDPEAQLRAEILRYAVDIPGQALAYKMGGRHIAQLRKEAEAALGDRFDIRRFHDAVLGGGALPLGVLKEHIRWWIEENQTEGTR